MNDRTMPGTRGLRPTVAAALLAWLIYTLVVNAIQVSAGIPYADWFKTAANAWRIGVLSLAAGSGVLLVFVAVTRWNHLWRDPLRLPTTRLMRAGMVAFVLGIVLHFAGVDWGAVPGDQLLAIVVAGVLVGFAEETLFRGIFLRAMREGGRAESSAAIWTAVCFGLFHLPNVFMGMGWAGLLQLPLAALTGVMLYVFRRHYGSIWPAMIAHGIWDISTFLAGAFPVRWASVGNLGMQLVLVLIGLAVLIALARGDRQTIAIPGAPA